MSLTPPSGRDLALIHYGDALRRAKRRRRRLTVRLAAGALFVALVAASAIRRPTPRLIWNASASAPIGLYGLHPGATPWRGARVAAALPGRVADLAATRGYLPRGVPVIKTVAALPGDRICAVAGTISVNGTVVATTLRVDRSGRALPHWHGCRRLAADQYLLLNGTVGASFDGRYFGPSAGADILGTVTPLWLR